MKTKILLKTPDHWNIALYKYHNENVTKKYPVFLLHGIASNHTVWDTGYKEFDFSNRLTEEGFQVYSLDLRGRSGSDGPHTGRGDSWSIDDYLLCDLPAAIEYILEDCSTEKLHWVGHSLGGILGFFYQIRHKASNLQSLTAFASALTYTFSTINHMRTYMDYLSAMMYYPVDIWYKAVWPFIDMDTYFTRFIWNAENLAPEVKRVIITDTVQKIAVLEWNQIKTISAAEGMPRISGGFNHYVNDRRIVTPAFLITGDRDWVCAVDGVEWTRDQLKCPSKMAIFGKDYGSATHYGHMDIVCGINAPYETWPAAINWINEREDS
ncbi:MAG: alpha/beta fold hydrolase [Leptospiraceae bacterium]|nr:alpha/beta fold hydrolase [Leptospiraceae bacterium]